MAANNPVSALTEAARKHVKSKLARALADLLLENAPPDDLQDASPEMLAWLVEGRLAFLTRTPVGGGSNRCSSGIPGFCLSIIAF